jgi:transcription-repair coupling factor (superfamily II helicase)
MRALPAKHRTATRKKSRVLQKKVSPEANHHGSALSSRSVSSSSPLGLLALYLLKEWERSGQNGLIFVSEEERRAEQLGAVVDSLNPSCGVMVLPRQDTLPFDGLEPSPDVSGRRASVLRRLARPSQAPLVIATADALIQHVPAAGVWQTATLHLKKGDSIDQSELESFFARAGYSLESQVDTPGSAMLLAQLAEIYPAGALNPVRLRFSDRQITDIQGYDPETQRELNELGELTLDPVSEWCEIVQTNIDPDASESRAWTTSVFEYTPSARMIADFGATARANSWIQLLEEALGEDPDHSRSNSFLSRDEWEKEFIRRGASVLAQKSTLSREVPSFVGTPSPTKSLRAFLEQQHKLGLRIVFTAATEADLRIMDRRAGGWSERCAGWRDAMRRRAAQRTSLIVDFDRGFMLTGNNGVVVIAAADLMGSRAAHQNPMALAVNSAIQQASELRPGDVVVHMDRGFSILRGLELIRAAGVPEAEMVRLEFAEGETVLIPVEELRAVWRYSSDPVGIALDKADGSSWRKRRVEVEHEIAETAARLIELRAERERRTAPIIVPPVSEYERFAARFPHFPTPDQSKSIEEVLQDLASGRPTDRLVCGDVGYGKTEVALRATAAVAFTGRQVAVAVPTTVLARQHVQTFRKRFAPFGIEIGHLSRFTSAAEARAVKKALSDGSLLVVIGTHALASKAVQFADLGLVVIDEEQRFGKADKEKLARFGQTTHLLTMTATPIPRTMSQLSSGIRPVSEILTPPARRLPVRTVAQQFDNAIVAAALRREHRRRGQSFVVCPRIEDIAPMEARLKAVVPELILSAVHGKMPVRDLEQAMTNFADGKADILLTTNIIENGLDLARANTIMIWRPERFGMAQLHQLRGRVGRSGTRAFAYLLTDPDAPESSTASTRLHALCANNRCGAGLQISQKDLDLRGGGDLFSDQQSGHVKILGPALYRHLLERATSKLQGGGGIEEEAPELHLDVSRLLPNEYIQNDAARLEMYARISKCQSQGELDAIENELEERFGEVPTDASNLLAIAGIELNCRRAGVQQLNAGPDGIAAILRDWAWPKIRRRAPIGALSWKDGRVIYRRRTEASDRLRAVRELLDILVAG